MSHQEHTERNRIAGLMGDRGSFFTSAAAPGPTAGRPCAGSRCRAALLARPRPWSAWPAAAATAPAPAILSTAPAPPGSGPTRPPEPGPNGLLGAEGDVLELLGAQQKHRVRVLLAAVGHLRLAGNERALQRHKCEKPIGWERSELGVVSNWRQGRCTHREPQLEHIAGRAEEVLQRTRTAVSSPGGCMLCGPPC